MSSTIATPFFVIENPGNVGSTGPGPTAPRPQCRAGGFGESSMVQKVDIRDI